MSSLQHTPGIYNGITHGTLLRYDYNEGTLTQMDLNKYFEGNPFKIKILDRQGVDMCLEDKEFISDIKFTEANRDFIKKLTAEKRRSINGRLKENLETVNYDDEENWTLTYRLRGFKIAFDVSPNDVIDSYMARLIHFVYI